jgi:hypothetical protein
MANQGSKKDTTGSETTPAASSLAQGDLGTATAEVTEQVQEKAGHLTDQIQAQVTSRLAGQKDRAAGGLETAALLLRQAGEQVRQQDQAMVAQYLEGAAERVERFSTTLGQQDVGQLVEDVEQFARRRPAVFLGGAATIGFLGARFLRSSAASSQPTAGGSSAGQSTQPAPQPETAVVSQTSGSEMTQDAIDRYAPVEAGATADTTLDDLDLATTDADRAASLSDAMVEARLDGTPLIPADYSPRGEER